MFVTWSYPIGFYRNAAPTNTVQERGAAMLLPLCVFLLFTTTFGYLIQAAIETAETAGNAASGLFTFWLVFCGYVTPSTGLPSLMYHGITNCHSGRILVSPSAMPGFWTWMYFLSPFTYLISAVLSVGLSHT